ncbi:MAG: CocE/NonD family hydrolase, partial [Acidimicrobiales bacterium]
MAGRAALWASAGLLLFTVTAAGGPVLRPASASVVTEALSFKTSSGIVLHATVGGFGTLTQRPVIIEDSPYAPDDSTLGWVGSDFNFVELQWQGTGLSEGSLDAAGPDDQSDLSQFLGWACAQPWSDGTLGLYGFSASAIVAYNAMHLPMP